MRYVEWWLELRRWVVLCIPTAVMLMCRMLMGMTDLAFVGHLGTNELAAASLVIVYASLVSSVVFQGGAKAISSLCAMAYGAEDMDRFATLARVGTLATFASAIPLALSLWYCGAIMAAIAGASPEVESMVTLFSRPFIPVLLVRCIGACLNNFLLAQKVTAPQLVGAAVGVVLNVVFNAWFISGFTGWPFGAPLPPRQPNATATRTQRRGLGLIGSPLATLLSSSVVLLITFSSALLSGRFAMCSPLLRRRACRGKRIRFASSVASAQLGGAAAALLETAADAPRGDVRSDASDRRRSSASSASSAAAASPCARYSAAPLAVFAKQALPMAATAALEEAQLQLIAVFAARLGVVALGTHNAILEVVLVLTTLMWATGAATRVRTAHHLGRGSVADAKRVACIGVGVSGALAVGIALVIYALRHTIGRIFSSDDAVVTLAAKITEVMAPTYVVMAAFYSSMAVLTAQGRPTVIAIAFVLGGWGVSVPASYVFAYVWPRRDGAFARAFDVAPDATRPHGLGLIGLWIGLALGFVVIGVVSSTAVLTSRWERIVKHVREDVVATEGRSAQEATPGAGERGATITMTTS